jgi:hypothetical protein
MAEDKRWWKRDKDSDTSKEDVEDLLNEAEAKRLQREEELAEAEHREKMAEFTDPAPSIMKESESGDGSPVEYIGQRLVLKPDERRWEYRKYRQHQVPCGHRSELLLGPGKAWRQSQPEARRNSRDLDSSWPGDGVQDYFA